MCVSVHTRVYVHVCLYVVYVCMTSGVIFRNDTHLPLRQGPSLASSPLLQLHWLAEEPLEFSVLQLSSTGF